MVCFASLLVSIGVKDLTVGLTVFSRFMKREGVLLGTRLGGLVFTTFIVDVSVLQGHESGLGVLDTPHGIR